MTSESTAGKAIRCRAAICWAPKKRLTIETVEVSPPKAGEVRIKVIANSICHTDLHVYTGHGVGSMKCEFPCILGHEAIGVVESVGEQVTSVTVGDHVISLFNGECGNCDYCKNPKTNLCEKRKFDEPRMADGTTRFKHNGNTVFHFLGISALSEYTVISETQVAKINPKARMDRACIFACGFSTGYGSAVNVAKVEKGANVAVWGLGPVGLAAVYGARKCGAVNIIGIDVNEKKKDVAMKMGCTHFLNPIISKKENSSTPEAIKKITNGVGVDFALECVGQIKPVEEAIDATAVWGKIVVVGVYPGNEKLSISPNAFLSGKKLTGALFGGYKSREWIPRLVEEYVQGNIEVDEFFTGSVKLDDVDSAFEKLLEAKVLRTVVMFQ